MTTEQAIELLSASIDRSLTPAEQSALDAWLAADPEHRILADGLRHQHADLRTTFEPRREEVSRVVARVAGGLSTITPPPSPAVDPGKPGWQRLFNPYSGTIAAALVIGLGLVAFRAKNINQQNVSDTPVTVAEAAGAIGMKPREKPADPKAKTLAVGETVVTVAGEKRRVILPDGSILYLNQNTNVELTSDRHLKLTAGDLFVEAVPEGIAPGRFIVDTPARSVTAMGTKFAVSAAKAGTGVIVTQGKVRVSDIADPVASGEQLRPDDLKPTQAPRGACAVEWTRELMIAAEAPLVPAGKHSGGSLVAVDPYGQEAKLGLVKFHVDVHIEEGFARTTIDQTFFNNENQQLEGTFYFPLPPDASLNRLAMYVDGNRMEGGMAERDHARNVYETIRHQRRDPALLEWVDGSVFKMRVFPLPAREEKRIILSYTQKLNATYGRSAYRFPSGHSLSHVGQWSFQATLKNADGWSVASPSHPTMKSASQGSDVILTDKARDARIDRDVVLELSDPAEAARQTESTRWSEFTQDGERYLMLRHKPELPMGRNRERRDWVFLFESSGARDPLVARTQVEVIRSLLNHAEHEDTFTVMTVGTRVRSFTPGLVPATGENAARAIQWLEQAHLIGALNIEEAFVQSGSLLKDARNPHIVHVGGGIASYGEQRPELLMRKLPPETKYVGIAVGRRFSTTLMKTAAEKTGGLFAQINPDEPIAWRGFEVASTLNAPRLLNVKLEVPGLEAIRFLPFAGNIAHGEELVAIARITPAQPSAVKITGLLDGAPYEKTLVPGQFTPGAGHLPRSWAKLEIDRLLALNTGEHQARITELSKQMYVMTPFTSLLVLENEQMYRDFKVDRGRKDHWATYPAPDKIPVVHIPDPNSPWSAREAVAGQKPHENQVLSTILTRQAPVVLQGPGLPGQPPVLQNAAQRFGTAIAIPDEALLSLGDGETELAEEFSNSDLGIDGTVDAARATGQGDKLAKTEIDFRRKLKESLPALRTTDRFLRISDESRFRRSKSGKDRLQDLQAYQRQQIGQRTWDMDGTNFLGRGTRVSNGTVNERMLIRDDFGLLTGESESQLGRIDGRIRGEEFGESRKYKIADLRAVRLHEAAPERAALGQKMASFQRGGEFTPASNGPVNLFFQSMDDSIAKDQPARFALPIGSTPAPEPLAEFAGFRGARFGFEVSPPAYYNRPGFAFSERLFRDLASFAPGMSSLPADVRAVIEAEAAPRFGLKRGEIDPAAKKLFDTARAGMGWRVTMALQLDGSKLRIVHDGLGRYAYDRQIVFGLREYVVCDGTTLWHSYPEIGLGSKRTVSRFHRAEFLELIPDALAPIEDLNVGADVRLVKPNIVAIIPHHLPDEDGKTHDWTETYYVFGDGRLTEVYAVRQPDKSESARTVFARNGDVMVLSAAGKQIASAKMEISQATEPVLKPVNQSLVVLPLPLRTRDIVLPKIGMEPQWGTFDANNECWSYLGDEEMMALLATEFAVASPNISTIVNHMKQARNDRRPGLDVLLASLNFQPRIDVHGDDMTETLLQGDPLTRYLYREFDNDTREWNKKFGFALPAAPKTDFLSRLATLRVIYDRFTGPHTNHPWWGIRDAEVKRALNYVTQHAGSSLGWAALGLVSDVGSPLETQRWKADAWGLLAEKSPFPYAARYEQARLLSQAGRGNEALVKFRELFREALSVGILPSVDEHFRVTLSQWDEGEWPTLMRQMAAKCALNKARPVVVLLAWQCWQLGDIALSDTMLEAAVNGATEAEAPIVHLWAVQFLTATNRHDRADSLLQPLLTNKRTAASSQVWRLASGVAASRQDQVRSIECLEKALDIEFKRLPETFDINPIRQDYGRLLAHYEWLADAAAKLRTPTPGDLPTRLVRAVDRWRQLDPEAESICQRSGAVLRKIGSADALALAWDYETTPLALKPNESGPWESLANRLRLEGDWKLADRAYEMAWLAEPTNAQLLWNRAQHLKEKGQIAESRRVFQQLASGEWQPRFAGLASMAKSAAGGQ